MKNIILFTIPFFIAIGCSKEYSNLEERTHLANSSNTFFAEIESNKSKTVLNSSTGKIMWSPNDEINIFSNGQTYKYTSSNEAAANSTTFIGSMDDSANTPPYLGLFPYNTSAYVEDNSITTLLPDNQTGIADSFDDDLFISVARSYDHTLKFRNVCGGIRFSVTTEGIKKVTFKGNQSEPLAGKITVSFDKDNVPYISELSSETNTITLSCPNGFEPSKWYYIVSIPQTLQDGYTLTFETDDKIGSFRSNSNTSIKRSVIKSKTNIDQDIEWEGINNYAIGDYIQNYGGGVVFDIENDFILLVSLTELHDRPWAEAISWCKSYGDGGWYLPSIEELKMLQAKLETINSSLSNIPEAQELYTGNKCYWSSTENGDYAWRMKMDGQTFSQGNDERKTSYANYTRAIRKVYLIPGYIPVNSISIDKTDLSLKIGEGYSFTANILPNEASNKSVVWSSNNTSIATVDNYGNVSAVSQGRTEIKATTEDGGFSATCNLRVYSDEPTGNIISFEDPIVKDICVANFDKNGDGEISEEEISDITSFSGIFKNTDIVTFNEIQYFKSLSLIEDYGFSGCKKLQSLSIPETVNSIGEYAFSKCTNLQNIILPSSLTVIKKGTFSYCESLHSITLPESIVSIEKDAFAVDISTIALSYSVAQRSIKQIYSPNRKCPVVDFDAFTYTCKYIYQSVCVSSYSVYCPKDCIEDYESNWPNKHYSIIYETSPASWWGYEGDSRKIYSFGFIKPNQISINKTSLSINIDEQEQLIATILPSNASDHSVVWKSSNEDIASVDQNGVVCGKSGGDAIITAYSNADKSLFCNCEAKVNAFHVTSISLNDKNICLYEGDTYSLIATILPENATNKHIIWESSDNSVASVDENGKVNALAVGTADIKATASDGGVYDICKLTVLPVSVTNVSLDKSSIALREGETCTVHATISPINATDKRILWKSYDDSIAKVDNNGTIEAIRAGSTTIIVLTSDGDYKDSCFVSVKTVVPNGAVDLGLSVYWATCNIGASSPKDHGDYYAWGETETRYKTGYDWSIYKWGDGLSENLYKYVEQSAYGQVDGKTILESEDDVAYVQRNNRWRMPTKDEWEELQKNCIWTWTTLDGVQGFKCTSKISGFENKSIFLPAAGWYEGTNLTKTWSYIYSIYQYGAYWSSSLSSDNSKAYYQRLVYDEWYENASYGMQSFDRCFGLLIRPVSE